MPFLIGIDYHSVGGSEQKREKIMTKQEKNDKAVSLLNIASQSLPDAFSPLSRAISTAKNRWIPYINSFESKRYPEEGDTCVYDGYNFLETVDYNGECSEGLEVWVHDSGVSFKQHSDKDDYDELSISTRRLAQYNITEYIVRLQTYRYGRSKGSGYEVVFASYRGNRFSEGKIMYDGSIQMSCGYNGDGTWWCHK